MRNLIKILLLTFFAAITVFAQDNFVSVDGGFAIDLPKAKVSIEKVERDYGDWFSRGEAVKWQVADNPPNFVVQYSKFEATSGMFGAPPKKLTQKLKTSQIDIFGKALSAEANKNGSMYKETAYSANGMVGKEWHLIAQDYRSIMRIFFVKNTYYFIAARFSQSEDEETIRKTLDSFRLLTRQEVIDIKVKLAEPKPLPQSPTCGKPFSDTHDENLKGKVRTIIKEYQETVKSKRGKSSETFYNENGNLSRETTYERDYPDLITVWGCVDNFRAVRLNFTDIYFDDEPLMSIRIRTTSDTTKVSDERYDSKYLYKYNEKEQLIEKKIIFNDETVSTVETFEYVGNERKSTTVQPRNKNVTKSSQIYDVKGDMIKETYFDEKGKVDFSTSYTYELDTKGNWIVQKSFDNVKMKGKTVLKPSSIIYRTITYYD
jgi:hypothetical protein